MKPSFVLSNCEDYDDHRIYRVWCETQEELEAALRLIRGVGEHEVLGVGLMEWGEDSAMSVQEYFGSHFLSYDHDIDEMLLDDEAVRLGFDQETTWRRLVRKLKREDLERFAPVSRPCAEMLKGAEALGWRSETDDPPLSDAERVVFNHGVEAVCVWLESAVEMYPAKTFRPESDVRDAIAGTALREVACQTWPKFIRRDLLK